MKSEELALAIYSARTADGPLHWDARIVPGSVDEALQVQNQVSHLQKSVPRAWKVGRIDGAPVVAPMVVHNNPLITPRSDLVVECEVAVVLGKDLKPQQHTSPEDVLDAVSRSFCGLEIVLNRAGANPPPLLNLADSLSNYSFLCGSGEGVSGLLLNGVFHVKVSIGGAVFVDQPCDHLFSNPIVVIADVLNAGYENFLGFKAGDIVTTGALGGAHPLRRGSEVRAEIQGIGTAEFLSAAHP